MSDLELNRDPLQAGLDDLGIGRKVDMIDDYDEWRLRVARAAYPLSPADMAALMSDVSDNVGFPTDVHQIGDEIMIRQLVALGYGDAMLTFRQTERWYE